MKKFLSVALAIVILGLGVLPSTAYALSWDQRTAFVKTAQQELDEGYDSEGRTVYGKWYGDHTGSATFTRGHWIFSHEEEWAKQPWCAMFVSWCANENGLLDSDVLCTASVPTMQKWYQDNGKYKSKGSYVPVSGDLVFFKDADGNWAHVGIVESVSHTFLPAIGYSQIDLTCIEGDYWKDDNYKVVRAQYLNEKNSVGSLTIAGYGVN